MSAPKPHRITSHGPGTPDGPALPATGPLTPPSAIDRGHVSEGKVEFPSWKGDEDKPAPTPFAPLPPDHRVRAR